MIKRKSSGNIKRKLLVEDSWGWSGHDGLSPLPPLEILEFHYLSS